MKRWIVVICLGALLLALGLAIYLSRVDEATCQSGTANSSPVATPTDAQRQYDSSHDCGGTPRHIHSSITTPTP
jgi:hypothetical protein